MIDLCFSNNLFENISHVIFDKDGTISDSHLYWGEIIRRRSVLLSYHCRPSIVDQHEIEFAMGYDHVLRKLVREGPIAIKNRDEVIDILHKFLASKGVVLEPSLISAIFEEVHLTFCDQSMDFIEPISGVKEFIISLKQNDIPISLVTSDTERGARNTLLKMGLENDFEFVAGKDSGLGHKVTGRPAEAACKYVGRSLNNTLVLGDAPMDFTMARNAGINNIILIASGQIPLSDLCKLTPSCDNISQISILPK